MRCYVPHRVGHQLTLGLPVILENDANTLTAAEQWFGLGHGVDHFIVIVLGSGIGAGSPRCSTRERLVTGNKK